MIGSKPTVPCTRMFTLRRILSDGKRRRKTVIRNGEVVVTMSGKSPSASISRSMRSAKSASSSEIAMSP